MPTKCLVINPNSSQVITESIEAALNPLPGTISVSLSFFTCPPSGPPAIDNQVSSILSATESYRALLPLLPQFDGFLVCCFSDHPLVPMLKEHTTKPVVGIFQASLVHALLLGKKFGIVTSGRGWIPALTAGVRDFLGANASDRFAGVSATGLGVLELKQGDPKTIRRRVRESAAEIAVLGADVIILGCAGMAGMESVIKQGALDAGTESVTVVDGIHAGVRLLVGLV